MQKHHDSCSLILILCLGLTLSTIFFNYICRMANAFAVPACGLSNHQVLTLSSTPLLLSPCIQTQRPLLFLNGLQLTVVQF